MKHYKEIITLICLTLVCLSCEKSSEQDTDNPDDNKTENNNTGKKDDNTGNGDNGGWANDDKDNKNDNADYEEWSDGEHANVTYFINNSLDGEAAVWVDGYIVGCATSSDGYKFQFSSPFDYATSILLSDKKNETDKKHIMTIQLKSGSEYRKKLNLKDNPDLYNKRISICGYKTTYLKLPGMKELLDYKWLEQNAMHD